MPALHDLITVLHPSGSTNQPEDIFAASSSLIFPDDLSVSHGNPGNAVIYHSPRFGDIKLRTTDPDADDERRLFSHYVWNSGIRMARLIGDVQDENWSVEGETVLELGAGTGIVGIVAVLSGARRVIISDYPSTSILENLEKNAEASIPNTLRSRYEICGHGWGDLTSPFAKQNEHSSTRILVADCLWMPSQHTNLINSILHFLTLDTAGRVLMIAGFHTGRMRVAGFFDDAVDAGLDIEEIYEQDNLGNRREWLRDRDGGHEDHVERKKWLIIARLKRTSRDLPPHQHVNSFDTREALYLDLYRV